MEDDPDEASLKELQENEVEALKAIFGSDFSDLREADVWKKSRPFEILLKLFPENSTRGHTVAHVSVCLHVKAGPRYPLVRPSLALKDLVGLSETRQGELLKCLEALANSLEGGEMVYQLAVEVATFLALHNRKGFGSMAEEMEARRREEQEKREEGVSQMEDIRRKDLIREVEERRKEIEEEHAKVKIEERKRTVSECERGMREGLADTLVPKRKESFVSSVETKVVEVRLSFQGDEKVILRGRILGTNGLGQVTYSGFCRSSGRLLAVTRWVLIPPAKGKSGKEGKDKEAREAVIKQLGALEQELGALARSQSHPNLVPYYGLGWTQSASVGVEVHLAQDLVPGTSLSNLYMVPGCKMDLDLARTVCQGVLAALVHLHSADVVHRDMRHSSIFLGDGLRVQLADFSLDCKLRELVEEVNHVTVEDLYSLTPGRRGKKSDIYRLGILVLSLVQGRVVGEQVPAIPSGLPSTFRDFLSRCLAREEKERWGASSLLDHDWVREPVQYHLEERPRSPSPPPASVQVSGLPGQGQSRLLQDFEVLEWIGKGGFGDVLKVRNLLDGRKYAIKRIRLNPADKGTNRKIMREVKLLSRLNHENVVRYYNSWHELTTTSSDTTTTETETSSGDTDKQEMSSSTRGLVQRSFRPPATVSEVSSLEWSVSWLPQDSPESEDSSDDSDSDSENCPGSKSHLEESSSHIVFDCNSRSHTKSVRWEEREENGSSESGSSQGVRVRQIHYMYIQMEFCDKQTLRSCIDNELYKDKMKVWRMFREIIEGLLHIHTQGMIHRDLKPVNIFIDSSDHLKIGDFGLATTGLLGVKEEETGVTETSGVEQGEELTGEIGTAMYVAPELLGGRVTSYNQKVDLYSLGVILFEMCSPPLVTGMERYTVLGRLRSSQVELPSDWDTVAMPQQTHLVRWLLNHDPNKRPSSAELAQSDWLPPAQVEERQMQQLVKNTMKNPRAPAYRRLMEACLAQPMSLAKDVSYDSDLSRPSTKLTAATEQFLRVATSVFSLHGGVRVEPPLLLPRTEAGGIYRGEEEAVAVMTRGGDTVTLPYDLRVGYARYLARLGTHTQRRYIVGRLLREMKVFGLHPKEHTECAFDIAGPDSGRSLADAEVMVVIAEVLSKLDCWTHARLYYRVSHADLAAACLEQAGVGPEAQEQVMSAMQGLEMRGQMSSRLSDLGLPEQAITSVAPLLEAEGPLSQLSSILRSVTKRRGAAAERVKAALAELRKVEAEAVNLGLSLEMVYCVRPAPRMFSGILVQLVRDKQGKGGTRKYDVLAAGGRYDRLVHQFSDSFRLAAVYRDRETNTGATGISIEVDKVVLAMAKQEGWKPSLCQVLVGGDKEEATKCVKELWASGLKARLEDSSSGDCLMELAREVGAELVVVCSSEGGALISQPDREGRWLETRKVGPCPGGGLARWGLALVGGGGPPSVSCVLDTRTGEAGTLRDKEERPPTVQYGACPVVNYNFTFLDSKKYSQSKEKLRVRKSEKLATALGRFDPSTQVEVLAIGFTEAVVRAMVNCLDLEDEERLARSLEELCGQHPRYRKEFRNIVEEIRMVRFGPKCPVIVLYSLEDHKFKIIC